MIFGVSTRIEKNNVKATMTRIGWWVNRSGVEGVARETLSQKKGEKKGRERNEPSKRTVATSRWRGGRARRSEEGRKILLLTEHAEDKAEREKKMLRAPLRGVRGRVVKWNLDQEGEPQRSDGTGPRK